MARKVDKAQDSAGESPALDAVAALTPEVKATIAGRELVFREYAVFEGFEVAGLARAFIDDLYAEGKGGGLRYAHVRRLLGLHQAVVVKIAAMSADVDEAFVRGLSREDAEAFFANWFMANAGFFVREVLWLVRQEQVERSMGLSSIGSSSGSPAPASGASSSSSASPSAN